MVTHLAAEHADDLAALVVDHGLGLLVVQDRNGEAAGEVRVGLEVDLAEVGEGFMALTRVRYDILAGYILVLGIDEPPSCEFVSRVDGNHSFEEGYYIPFGPRCQCTTEKEMMSSKPLSFRTIRAREAYIEIQRLGPTFFIPRFGSWGETYPGTGVADVEVIPPFLRREARTLGSGDPFPE